MSKWRVRGLDALTNDGNVGEVLARKLFRRASRGTSDTMPAISVLLPVHNCERFVLAAVDSVLRQTHSDFELIVIDDGSADGSLQLLRRAAADPRIRLYSRANKGLVETLNECVDLARAPWVARMDADDICEPTRLSRQLAYCCDTGADVCGSAIIMFSERRSHVRSYPERDEDIRLQLAMGTAFAHPSVFGKTECFRAHRYRDLFPHAEDYDLWTRFALAGYKLGNLGEPLLRYRLSPKQVSRVHLSVQFASASMIAIGYRTVLVERLAQLRNTIRSDMVLRDALERNPSDVESVADLMALSRLLMQMSEALETRQHFIGDYLCYLARHNRRIPLASLFFVLASLSSRDRASPWTLLAVVAHRLYFDRMRSREVPA